MNVVKKLDGDKFELKVEGRLDTTTAPELDEEIKAAIDDVKELVFDFGKLEYISSAGLRVILSAQKIMNGQGEMQIINACELVRSVFVITGMDKLVNFV